MPKRKIDNKKIHEELKNPIEVEFKIPQILFEESLTAADEKFYQGLEGTTQYITHQREKKFRLLAALYGQQVDTPIDPNNLAFQIACDFIDGFKVVEKKKKGRNMRWNSAVLYRLWHEVEQKKAGGHSALNACRLLMKVSPWKELMSPHSHVDALYKNYLKAQKCSFVRFVKNIQNHLQKQNDRADVAEQMYLALTG